MSQAPSSSQADKVYPPRGWVETSTLMSIENLELRAKIVVEGLWNGLHQSPYHGFSAAFSEYRPYVLGDDLRFLDWRLLARTDRFYIKKFQDETNLKAYLMVDQSVSMAYGSLPYTKSDFANTLAATLSTYLATQGDSVGLLTFADKVRHYLRPERRVGGVRPLLLHLDQQASGNQTDLSWAMDQAAKWFSKKGLVVLFSDLLVPLETWEKNLLLLMARGHEVWLFQVLDPMEIDFNWPDSGRMRDMETGKELYIDGDLARTSYRERFQAHQTKISNLCQRHGITHFVWNTQDNMAQRLFRFLTEKMNQPKPHSHRRR